MYAKTMYTETMYTKTMQRILGASALLAMIASVAAGQIIEVPAMAPTIGDAIAMATPGDEVVVSPGTYDEVLLIAGTSITLRSTDGAAATLVDGGGAFSVLTLIDADNTVIEGFTFTGGSAPDGGGINVESSDGVAIRDCVVSGNEAVGLVGMGGGIRLLDSDGVLIASSTLGPNAGGVGGGLGSDASSFALQDSTVSGNVASGDGGGLYVLGLFPGGFAPEITDTTIAGNTSGADGGGAAALSAFAIFDRVEVRDNDAAAAGGGIFSSGGATFFVLESVIDGNSATAGGGAFVDDHDGIAEFRNTMITDNTATALGGGVFMQDVNGGGLSTPGLFLGATLSGNLGSSGGGLYAQDSRVSAVNTILWGNLGAPGSDLVCSAVTFADTEVALDFSDIDPAGFVELGGGDCVFGIGNVFADPMFADPAMGDYHLDVGSPLIDAGFDTALAGPFDFEADSRDIDGDGNGVATTDIGADEACAWVKGDADGDGLVNIADMLFVLAYLFQGGTAPMPLERADFAGDGVVDLGDVARLGAFLFSGGPPPLCRP